MAGFIAFPSNPELTHNKLLATAHNNGLLPQTYGTSFQMSKANLGLRGHFELSAGQPQLPHQELPADRQRGCGDLRPLVVDAGAFASRKKWPVAAPLGSDRVPFAWFVDQAWFSHSGIVPPSGCNPLAPVGFAGCCLVSVVVVVGTLVATGKESVANFRVLEPPSVQMRSGLEQAHRRLVKGSQREAARKAGSSIFYRHTAASWLAGGLDLRSCSTEEGSHVLAVSS